MATLGVTRTESKEEKYGAWPVVAGRWSRMTDWSVEIEADVDTQRLFEEWAEDLIGALDELGASSPAVSGADEKAVIRVFVSAQDPASAVWAGEHFARDALTKAGVGVRTIRSAEAVEESEFERRLDAPTFPTVMGVAEVAARLNVTKQRVSELCKEGTLPTPVARLAAGPIWTAPMVHSFAESRDRRQARKPAAGE